MLLDRSLDDPELAGDLLVQQAASDQAQHLTLARRQGLRFHR